MRIRSISIENYGVFRQKRLEFAERGLQLIHGPNEAGKSTLLSLLRELLFGFPHRNPYRDETATGEMSATARLLFFNGEEIEMTRRKGRKATIRGRVLGSEDPVDQEELRRRLGHANENLYRNIFAFSLEELSQGETLLSQNNVRDTLYGSGLGGLTRVEGALKSLDEEIQSLYSPRGTTKPIHRLLRGITETKRELREACLRPQVYTEREQALRDAEEKSEALRKELEMAMTARNRNDALLRAWDPWERRRRLEKQRDAAPPSPDIPEESARLLGQNQIDGERLRTESLELEDQIEELAERLKSLRPRPHLLERQSEIQNLHTEIDKITGFRRDIPLRQKEESNVRREVQRNLEGLGPNWSVDELSSIRISTALLEEIDASIEEKRNLDHELARTSEEREGTARRMESLELELETLAASRGSEDLETLIRRSDRYLRQREELEELRGEVLILEAESKALAHRLCPPCPSPPDNPLSLLVPARESIEEFGRQFLELDGRLKPARERIAEIEQECDRLHLEIAGIEADGSPPTRKSLEEARAHRDRGWKLLRDRLRDRLPSEGAVNEWLGTHQESLPDAYQDAVARADRISDDRMSRADAVARREQKEGELRSRQRILERLREDLADLASERKVTTEKWNDLWSGCGWTPLSPHGMKVWLDTYRELASRTEARARVEDKQSRLRSEIDPFEERLRKTLESGEEAEIDDLLTDLRNRATSVRESVSRQNLLEQQVTEAGLTIEELDAREQILRQRLSEWQRLWKELIAPLDLPSDRDPAFTQKIVRSLEREARRVEHASGLADRVEKMQRELKDFEARVATVSPVIAPELRGRPPEALVETLLQELRQAQETETQRSSLQDQLELQTKRLRKVKDRVGQLDRENQRLFEAAKVKNEKEFLEASERARQAREVQESIRQLERELALLVPEDDPEFLKSFATEDRASLERRQEELADRVETLKHDYGEALKLVGTAKRQLEELDGESRAATLAGTLESLRSELSTTADRYIPLVLARGLVRRAVAKFERDHQPEMLREVSRLFSRLTGGHYPSVRRRLDREGTLLAIQEDGTEKHPAQLSTGTREQLYLAIRLAYVQEYCRHNEPLPLVLDDVLVNFDESRADNTLRVLKDLSKKLQILLLTCHDSTLRRTNRLVRNSKPIRLLAQGAQKSGEQAVLPALEDH